MGVEVLTLRPLALELAAERLAEAGLEPLDEFAEQSALDAALDDTLEEMDRRELSELSEGVGFRGAVRDAVQALRLAGVSRARLSRSRLDDRPKRALMAGVLTRFEDRLRERRRADTADVLREAALALERHGSPGYDRILVLPGLGRRGLAGRLLELLLERDATVLPAETPVGLDRPDSLVWRAAAEPSPLSWLHAVSEAPRDALPERLELFRAASVTDELKEVLRRVVEAGLPWDEVEIVATDAGVYGPALHALAGRMRIPVTFGVGLPVERTRVGRAVEAFFRWIQDDFPSPVIRRLLESGILRPAGKTVPGGAALARRLRALRVGWGRERYRRRLDAELRRLERGIRPGPRESEEQAERRRRRHRRQLRALRELVLPTLEALPELPRPAEPESVPVSPAALARGLARFLECVPVRSEVDATALDRLRRILGRVRAELVRPTRFDAAVALLREHLEIRVPAPRAEGPAPWRSTGGHLYLTDVQHGGHSGRRATFVVGLDASRAGGGAFQDPLLLDRERRTVAGAALPTSADRLVEGRFRLAGLLARLGGRVTLSYSAWDPAETRSVLPSSLLLQALRLRRGDDTLGYEALEEALGDPVAAVPSAPSRVVDAADVWLQALEEGGRLRSGAERVREAYPELARGLALRAAPGEDRPGRAHGIVEPRPERLDPRLSGDPVSATRLETLGACPRRYLFRYALGIRPPEDPAPDPERWLDPLQRGSLLHRVYERTLGEWPEGSPLEESAFAEHALGVLEAEAETARRETPPPSEAVYLREREELRADVRSFVEMVRADGRHWIELELSFGLGSDELDPVELPTRGGPLRVRGAVDRVDRKPTGLHLVDYKTGSDFGHGGASGIFRGGRRLQHLLYSEAVERILGEPVARLSYHFPTRRAENAVHSYWKGSLEEGMELVSRLLDQVREGRFLPTEDPGDCRFCDFRAICRVRGEGRDLTSPWAEWAARRFEAEEVFEGLREVRTWEA